MYDIWLKTQKPEKGDDTAAQASRENGKQIHMPTDYAEVTVSNHGVIQIQAGGGLLGFFFPQLVI